MGRTKESNKYCSEESPDSFINDMDTPENPKELCAKRPEKLIRLKSEVSKLPPQKVIDKHNLTHLPHEKWCLHCVEGRAIKDQVLLFKSISLNFIHFEYLQWSKQQVAI